MRPTCALAAPVSSADAVSNVISGKSNHVVLSTARLPSWMNSIMRPSVRLGANDQAGAATFGASTFTAGASTFGASTFTAGASTFGAAGAGASTLTAGASTLAAGAVTATFGKPTGECMY